MPDHVQPPVQTLDLPADPAWQPTGVMRWAVPPFAIAPWEAALQQEWVNRWGEREWRAIPRTVVSSEEYHDAFRR